MHKGVDSYMTIINPSKAFPAVRDKFMDIEELGIRSYTNARVFNALYYNGSFNAGVTKFEAPPCMLSGWGLKANQNMSNFYTGTAIINIYNGDILVAAQDPGD